MTTEFNERDDPLYSRPETFKEKFIRRNTENPFVIPTMGLCVYAMYQMIRAGLRGDPRVFQSSQRLRVGAQGLAVLLATGSFAIEYNAKMKQRAEQAAGLQPPKPSSPSS
ncbi:hypothetical protein CcCBS67573_g02476 [Chytriomyces confervae]|uniref:HIG1 domain-containing protein n=1 Tax=Chytriomyces confervae TaxID=246404 RepID=A0A507FKW3_9FUNG|nr:hypothetical protein HDU80_010546 [Chytriomyces hyalinus]TPX76275.1 hypothetical protein CcCBS67573_g02476 [Chytriomyces confervae]